MANLIIRKSATENISIPLTTGKPIARSLAVFKDGQIHYAPLVRSGDSLDSGVKVRIGSTNYALATDIYDPLTHHYGNKGWDWVAEGHPLLLPNRSVLLDGHSCFKQAYYYSLDASSYFRFTYIITPHETGGSTIPLVILLDNASITINLQITTRKYVALEVNGSTIKTFVVELYEGNTYIIDLEYNNNTFELFVNGTSCGTVSRGISSGNYTIFLGGMNVKTENFCGIMHEFDYVFDDNYGGLYFGD